MQHPGALQRLKDAQRARQMAGLSGQKQNLAASSDADNEAYMQQFEQAFSNLSANRQQPTGQLSTASRGAATAAPPVAAFSQPMRDKATAASNKTSQPAVSSTSSRIASSNSKHTRSCPAAPAAGDGAGPGSSCRQQAAPSHSRLVHSAAGASAADALQSAAVSGWRSGPVDQAGVLVELSERPLMCSAANWGSNEVVVGSSDHALYVVDVASGKKRRTLYSKTCGHTEWVTCVCYLPGSRVLSGGMDGRLWLWPSSGSSGTEIQAAHAAPVSKVACLTTPPPAAATGTGARIRGPTGAGSGASGPVLAVSCSYDKCVKVWDVGSGSRGKEVAVLRGHAGPVLEMDVQARGGSIATGDRKGDIMCWDLEAGSSSWGVAAAHQGHVTALSWQHSMLQPAAAAAGLQGQPSSSSCVVSGGQDGCVRVWDGRSGGCVAQQAVHVNKGGKGAVGTILPGCGSTGGLVLTAGADMTLQVLDPAMSFQPLHSVQLTDFPYSLAAVGGLAVCGCGDGSVHVVDLLEGRALYALGAGKAAIRAVEVCSSRLVCAGDDGYVISYEFC